MRFQSSDPATYYVVIVLFNGERCRHSVEQVDTDNNFITFFTNAIGSIPDNAQNVKRAQRGYLYDLTGTVEVILRDDTPLWAKRALGLEPPATSAT